jgi:predicted aldo/keto reductase-like oxidoreductase
MDYGYATCLACTRPAGSLGCDPSKYPEVFVLQYRHMGDTGIDVSAIGIGTMRFKDRDNAVDIINRSLDSGLTYIDIGPAYSFKSFDDNAEAWTGEAIRGRERSSMVISSKAQPRPKSDNPNVAASLGVFTRDQMWQCIENSLKRAGIGYFDFYQFWDMSAPDHFEAACLGDDAPLKALLEAKEQGLIRELGFTSHGQADDIISWLAQVPEFRTITVYYNFNDRHPERAVNYAHEHGVGVVVMGPLRGGLLVGQSPVFARYLPELEGAPVQEIALRFLLSTPAVSTVIGGINDPVHLAENVAVVEAETALTPEQRQKFVDAFQEFSKGEALCSGCNYCAGACPEELPISTLLGVFQLHDVLEMPGALAQLKNFATNDQFDASKCLACGICVEKCPQSLDIPGKMEAVAAFFAKLKSA